MSKKVVEESVWPIDQSLLIKQQRASFVAGPTLIHSQDSSYMYPCGPNAKGSSSFPRGGVLRWILVIRRIWRNGERLRSENYQPSQVSARQMRRTSADEASQGAQHCEAILGMGGGLQQMRPQQCETFVGEACELGEVGSTAAV